MGSFASPWIATFYRFCHYCSAWSYGLCAAFAYLPPLPGYSPQYLPCFPLRAHATTWFLSRQPGIWPGRLIGWACQTRDWTGVQRGTWIGFLSIRSQTASRFKHRLMSILRATLILSWFRLHRGGFSYGPRRPIRAISLSANHFLDLRCCSGLNIHPGCTGNGRIFISFAGQVCQQHLQAAHLDPDFPPHLEELPAAPRLTHVCRALPLGGSADYSR